MALIFDLQTHPVSGVIFDAQEYTPGFGTSEIALTPQGATSAGHTVDTDQQIVIYPQAQISYTAHQDVSVSGSIATAFTPSGSMAYAPPVAEHMVNGAIATALTAAAALSVQRILTGSLQFDATPGGSMLYIPAGGANINGDIGVSFTPLASMTYTPTSSIARYCLHAIIDIDEVLQ